MRRVKQIIKENRASKDKIDPLYVIFEEHLYNFHDADMDRKEFIARIVSDYLKYLRKNNIAVPITLEPAIIEELATQVNTMLVKKIYGCLNVAEFQKKASDATRRRVRSRYRKLESASKADLKPKLPKASR